MAHTIQNVLKKGYDAFVKNRRLRQNVYQAAESLIACRTAALGGHVQACPDGHVKRQWYNSCKHRMCPQCAFIQVERWLAKQKARLLGCDHFHVVFTLPGQLYPLWQLNRKVLSRLLFHSARDTLFELLGDRKYLGARPGLIASLHTWSRTLLLHPHLHVLVTGGGLTLEKVWIPVRRSYLLPFEVVRELFRGKLLAGIQKSLGRGELVLPDGMNPRQLKNLLNKLGRKKWNVHLRESYAHGVGVLIYLARYLRGGPISNKRIVRCEGGEVKFHYGRKKVALMDLPVDQFLGRLLQHVPPQNMIMVRSYGLYHHSRKEELSVCRSVLGQLPVQEPEFLDWQSYCSERGGSHPEKCPVCGKRLVNLDSIPKRRDHEEWRPLPSPERKVAHAA